MNESFQYEFILKGLKQEACDLIFEKRKDFL